MHDYSFISELANLRVFRIGSVHVAHLFENDPINGTEAHENRECFLYEYECLLTVKVMCGKLTPFPALLNIIDM